GTGRFWAYALHEGAVIIQTIPRTIVNFSKSFDSRILYHSHQLLPISVSFFPKHLIHLLGGLNKQSDNLLLIVAKLRHICRKGKWGVFTEQFVFFCLVGILIPRIFTLGIGTGTKHKRKDA